MLIVVVFAQYCRVQIRRHTNQYLRTRETANGSICRQTGTGTASLISARDQIYRLTHSTGLSAIIRFVLPYALLYANDMLLK